MVCLGLGPLMLYWKINETYSRRRASFCNEVERGVSSVRLTPESISKWWI